MSERLERMLAAVGAENAAEGSFVQDNVRAVAEELDRIESVKLNEMVNRFFPQLAMGDDLTLAAANFGVNRRGATPASVQVTLTGTPGTEIDGEIRVASGELIFACETGALGDDGKATILATCETPGAAGNVLPGTVTEFVTPYEGLDTVTNATAGFGGADEESDEDLLIRLEAKWANPSTGGNRGDYLRWALEVEGVARARAFNPSAGNVDVVVVAAGNREAEAALLAKVAARIEEVRPVGANVTVTSATAVPINLEATVQVGEGYALEAVEAAIGERFSAYIASRAFVAEHVSYLQVADLLFVDGVEDVSAYTLNGGSENISLEEREFAQMGTVTIHAS